MEIENVDTYLNYISHLDNEIRNLEAEKILLKQEMFKKHLFEVKLENLINELEKLIIEKTNDANAKVFVFANSLCGVINCEKENAIKQAVLTNCPFSVNFKYSSANYSKQYRISLDINIDQIAFPEMNYENYFDLETYQSSPTLDLKNIEKLKINLDPNARYMQDKLFSKAVFNCVRRKEKQQKTEKTPEK